MTPSEALDVAHRIAQRTARHADWSDGECTWTVSIPGRSPDGRSIAVVQKPAEGTLYGGTAGIGLFLLEAWRLTGDSFLLDTAIGALRRASRLAVEMPPEAFGWYAGRSGIAMALLRMAELTDFERWSGDITTILSPTLHVTVPHHQFDIISGAAGAMLALSTIGAALDAPEFQAAGETLADRLLETATRSADGWSWPGAAIYVARNLTGFAHGAAGAAHSLLEMYRLTGNRGYRYGAEQAFAYERAAFAPREGNWPDYRSLPVSRALLGGVPQLREWVMDGRVPARFTPSFMTAWCHGAAGIGLTRLRALDVLFSESYRDDVAVAIRAVEKYLDAPANYSLCHGVTGNCELLLLAEQLLDSTAAGETARNAAIVGRELYEDGERPWPTGVPGYVSDPALMEGETGIGYFYLRLADRSVPSVLLPTLRDGQCAEVSGKEHELQRTDRNAFFGRTLRLLESQRPSIICDGLAVTATGQSEVAICAESLNGRVSTIPLDERGRRIKSCFDLEYARYEQDRRPHYALDDLIAGFLIPPTAPIDWLQASFMLSPNARLITIGWDPDDETPNGAPFDSPQTYLLHTRMGTIQERAISPFSALVLESLEQCSTAEGIVQRLSRQVSDRRFDSSRMLALVTTQIKAAYEADIVTLVQATCAGAVRQPLDA